jgi:hypothetical protein
MDLSKIVIDVATLGQAFSVIVACWTIIAGIDAWKREFIGKRKIELAEQTLAKFFEIKDAITYIRNPFSHIGEGRTRERSPNETSAESEALDRGYVVVERYQRRETTFSDFQLLKYRFMATFGQETEEIFSETFKIVNSITFAATTLAHHYWNRENRLEHRPDAYERGIKEMQDFEKVIWDYGKGDDEIRLKLVEIQTKLEAVTKPCFDEAMGTYTALIKRWW